DGHARQSTRRLRCVRRGQQRADRFPDQPRAHLRFHYCSPATGRRRGGGRADAGRARTGAPGGRAPQRRPPARRPPCAGLRRARGPRQPYRADRDRHRRRHDGTLRGPARQWCIRARHPAPDGGGRDGTHPRHGHGDPYGRGYRRGARRLRRRAPRCAPRCAMSRPSTAELAAWDQQYLWHPFTQMRDWLAEPPLIVERGEGNYLVDTEGRRYFDGVSSLWCNVHGHRKRALDEALKAQCDLIAHSTMLGLANVPATVLGKRLVELTPPSLTRVFYSDAGATAVEIALKLALQYWQLRGEPGRPRFVALTEAYHGDPLGAVGVGYSETFHRFFRPVIAPALRIDPPHVFRWQRGVTPDRALELALADAARVFAAHGREVAALIVEPLMQGAAGMWAQPAGYLPALRELCRRHGALLICDEVATGFGRTR